jgi:hypothetical protein
MVPPQPSAWEPHDAGMEPQVRGVQHVPDDRHVCPVPHVPHETCWSQPSLTEPHERPEQAFGLGVQQLLVVERQTCPPEHVPLEGPQVTVPPHPSG